MMSMVRNVPFNHAGLKNIPGLSIRREWMGLIARLVHYLVVKRDKNCAKLDKLVKSITFWTTANTKIKNHVKSEVN